MRQWDPDRPWYGYAEQVLPPVRGRWIDFGAGRGELLERSAARHPGSAQRGIAFDLDRDAIRAAGRLGFPTIVGDLEARLPLLDASLDGATLVEAIEHVACTEALVEELARVIRPGGWLVLTTPNVAHLTYRLRALTGHAPKQEGYHVRFFVERSLRHLFERRGFAIEARASFGKQALLTRLARARGEPKVRYRVPAFAERLLAQHFVWRLRRTGEALGSDGAAPGELD